MATVTLQRFLRSVLLCISALIPGHFLTAQIWQPLGPDYRQSLTFDFTLVKRILNYNDTIYMALGRYSAHDNSRSLIIKRFNGQYWDTVGAPYDFISAGTTFEFGDITMDSARIPYVVYSGAVKKFVGGAWVFVGAGPGGFERPVIEVDRFGTPYVMGASTGTNDSIFVWKFDGTNWVQPGSGLTAGGALCCEKVLKFDTTGTPYVAYLSLSNFGQLVVMKLSGNSWVPVGGGGVTSQATTDITLAIGPDNQPWVGFSDASQGGKTTVKRFDGTSWQTVGSPGFSGPGNSAPGTHTELIISKSGVPYVLEQSQGYTYFWKFNGTNWVTAAGSLQSIWQNYERRYLSLLADTALVSVMLDTHYASRPVVRKSINGDWALLGDYGFTDSLFSSIVLETSDTDVPHIAGINRRTGRLSVQRYTSGSWVYLGVPELTSAAVQQVQLRKGKNDTMFVAYRSGGQLMLKRYDGNSWLNLPAPSAANLTSYQISSDTAGVLHLAYSDPGQFGNLLVRKYTGNTWVPVGGSVANVNGTLYWFDIGLGNTPYIVYTDQLGFHPARFTGGSWQAIPSPTTGLSQSKFALVGNDTLYFAQLSKIFQFSSSPLGSNVRKFDGTNWVIVGPAFIDTIPNPTIGNPNTLQFHLEGSGSVTPILVTHQFPETLIRGWNGQQWVRINTPAQGWANGIDVMPVVRSGPGNFVYAFFTDRGNHHPLNYQPYDKKGGSFGLGYNLSFKPAPPSVVGAVYYCPHDTAAALTASGQNLTWYTSATGTGSPVAPIPSTATAGYTTYYVTQTSGIWESDKDSITVVVFPQPNPTITANGSLLQASTGYSSYQWYYNSTLIPGAVSDTLTALADGSYHVVVTDGNGCVGTSPPYLVTDVGTLDPAPGIYVFPNPVTERLHVVSPVPVRLVLQSVDGRAVIASREGETLDLSGLSPGVYFLRILNTNGALLKVERLIKSGHR